MKISMYVTIPLIALAGAAYSCASTSPSQSKKVEPPASKRPYDSARGGLQITAIYYNQKQNRAITGFEDEWIVLESSTPVSLEGLVLDASDHQRFPLHGTLNGRLYVYTRYGPVPPNDSSLTLHYGNWIWNNTKPDIATIFDSQGQVIDMMTYIGI
jgi:hypothetical protein